MRRRFQPGFRLSIVDVLILAAGAAASAWTMRIDRALGMGIAFVVAHFFLFCNVLRMSRPRELIWAGAFAGLAAAGGLNLIAWPMVFGASAGVTAAAAALELRGPSYHGVGWRRVNPGLERWWEKQAGGEAGGGDASGPA